VPKPIAICIERLDADSGASQFTRCTAIAGGRPGLRVGSRGDVLWQGEDEDDIECGIACEIWVSSDEKLILFRPEGASAVALHRAGRSLDVPRGKPVLVIDRDEIDLGAHRLRLHVHGEASEVTAPSLFIPETKPLGIIGKAAAAVALGSAMAAGGCSSKDIMVRDMPPTPPAPPVEVRDKPPKPMPPKDRVKSEKTAESAKTGEADAADGPVKIEVRERPPMR